MLYWKHGIKYQNQGAKYEKQAQLDYICTSKRINTFGSNRKKKAPLRVKVHDPQVQHTRSECSAAADAVDILEAEHLTSGAATEPPKQPQSEARGGS